MDNDKYVENLDKPSRGYYLSLYEKALPESMTLREKSDLLLSCGYDGMELSVDESDARLARVLDPTEKKKVLQELRDAKIPVRTICLSGQRRFPFGSRDMTIRKKSIELVCRAIDFAVEAGIAIIQIPGYDVWYEERGEDTAAYFIEGLRITVPYAAKHGIILAFETMENSFMNTCSKAMTYVNEIRSPFLQIYPDTGNIRNGTDDPISDLKSAHGHIAAAHLKETKEGVFRGLEYGQGRVDFPGCIRELLGQGVGIFNCEFWYDGKTDPKEYITRNCRRIDTYFERAADSVRIPGKGENQ